MLKLTMTTALILVTLPAFAETIPGGKASNCGDKNGFYHPVLADGTTATYWNNATCMSPEGNANREAALELAENRDIDGDGDIGVPNT